MEAICVFHSETGTEGGFWAVQDLQHIHPPTDGHPYGRWDYEGLHILKDGDKLTIYSKDREVIWNGEIKLTEYPVFTEEACGMWIHSDQQGVDRETWAKYFMEESPCSYFPGPESPNAE